MIEMAVVGIDTSTITKVDDRTMDLDMSASRDAEGKYWYRRARSAARLLADEPQWLAQAIENAGLIHLSGITLAILSPPRARGAHLSFDPNVRPKLWSSPQQARPTLTSIPDITDIALPSFDDKATLWRDTSQEPTLDRRRKMGASEIAITDGAGPVPGSCDDKQTVTQTPIAYQTIQNGRLGSLVSDDTLREWLDVSG